MPSLPEPARALITSGALAHVVTINEDGSPQIACVWADVDGDDIVFFTRNDRYKTRNILRDPRVAISFESKSKGSRGLTQYLVVKGRATVHAEANIDELMDRLAKRHMNLDRFPFPREGQTLVRVAVERLSGEGPWSASQQ